MFRNAILKGRHGRRRPALPWLVLAALVWGIGVMSMYGVTRSEHQFEPRITDPAVDKNPLPTEAILRPFDKDALGAETPTAEPSK